MENIIQFPNNRKNDLEDVNNEPLKIPQEAGLEGFDLMSDEELMQSTIELINDIRIHLHSLSGVNIQKNISIRREILRDYSDRDIMLAVLKSTKNDWSAQPSFYAALLDLFLKSKIYAKRLEATKDYREQMIKEMDMRLGGRKVFSDEQLDFNTGNNITEFPKKPKDNN